MQWGLRFRDGPQVSAGPFVVGVPVQVRNDTADSANHIFGERLAFPLQLEDTNVLFRLGSVIGSLSHTGGIAVLKVWAICQNTLVGRSGESCFRPPLGRVRCYVPPYQSGKAAYTTC
jgi:hypothetical protein